MIIYNHWTGMVEWSCGITNSAKVRSKVHISYTVEQETFEVSNFHGFHS